MIVENLKLKFKLKVKLVPGISEVDKYVKYGVNVIINDSLDYDTDISFGAEFRRGVDGKLNMLVVQIIYTAPMKDIEMASLAVQFKIGLFNWIIWNI